MPSPFLRIAAPGALAAALLLSPLPAGAEAQAWDQAAVTKLAAELSKACIAVYDEYYAEQGMDMPGAGGDPADSFRLKNKLMRLEEESSGLAGALAGGRGRNETIPRVENVGELASDLRVIVARMYVESPLQQRLEAARAVWRKLLPYYGMSPPADEPPKGS